MQVTYVYIPALKGITSYESALYVPYMIHWM